MMMYKMMIFSLILLISAACTKGQHIKSDLTLIEEKDFGRPSSARYNREGNDDNVIQTRDKSFAAEYNPVSLTLKGTMLLYQRVISPQLSRQCPYEITCSNFSKHAIHEFGIVKGVFLSADRILRCNRIGLLDVHPLDFNDITGKIYDPPNKYQ